MNVFLFSFSGLSYADGEEQTLDVFCDPSGSVNEYQKIRDAITRYIDNEGKELIEQYLDRADVNVNTDHVYNTQALRVCEYNNDLELHSTCHWVSALGAGKNIIGTLHFCVADVDVEASYIDNDTSLAQNIVALTDDAVLVRESTDKLYDDNNAYTYVVEKKNARHDAVEDFSRYISMFFSFEEEALILPANNEARLILLGPTHLNDVRSLVQEYRQSSATYVDSGESENLFERHSVAFWIGGIIVILLVGAGVIIFLLRHRIKTLVDEPTSVATKGAIWSVWSRNTHISETGESDVSHVISRDVDDGELDGNEEVNVLSNN